MPTTTNSTTKTDGIKEIEEQLVDILEDFEGDRANEGVFYSPEAYPKTVDRIIKLIQSREKKAIKSAVKLRNGVRTCSNCNKVFPLTSFETNTTKAAGRSYICKRCNSKLTKEYAQKIKGTEIAKKMYKRRYLANKDRPEWRMKNKARERARKAVLKGEIVVSNKCEKCGATKKLQLHHEDYGMPLDVHVLCQPCHQNMHWQGMVIEEFLTEYKD